MNEYPPQAWLPQTWLSQTWPPQTWLLQMLRRLPEFNRLCELVADAPPMGPAAAFGLPEAHRAHVFAAMTYDTGGLFVAANEQSAERAHALASALSPRVALLPPRELLPMNAYAASGERASVRISTLVRLALGERLSIITSPEALLQMLAPPEALRKAAHIIKLGESHPPRELFASLREAGYEPVDLVEGPGQTALRGDILDVYPPHAQQPIRIEFFDDEVDRIGTYDAQSQRTIERLEAALLTPATEAPQDADAIKRARGAIEGAKGFDALRIAYDGQRASRGAEALLPALYTHIYSLLAYLPEESPICIEEPHRVEENAFALERLFHGGIAAMLQRGEGIEAQAQLQMDAADMFQLLHTPRTVLMQSMARAFSRIRIRESVQFDARPAPRYMGETIELTRDISAMRDMKGMVLLYAGEHADRLRQRLLDEGCETGIAATLEREPMPGEILILQDSLAQGFLYPDMRLSVLSETELFGFTRTGAAGGTHTGRPRARKRHSDQPRLVFSELKPGDHIVHEAHGIGRFVGVETLTVQEHERDYLLIEYAGGDRLYIPTDQLDRVQKYIGADETPRLSKLGGTEWQRQVNRARGAVKELAFDLAKLYVERQSAKGFAFSPDSKWQIELEAQFSYQETPDQAQSIADIKRDMESNRVMDRLLCGDVGYGKTEVALRAAFKAVQDSRQVAILVPTTILAQQHYNTLSTRFAGFPVRVALLSRFKTAQEQKQIKRALAEGQVDVVVGTHALLGKDVHFKNLGLLIVDEEQRFGVGHKEQIKTLKANVDVLTLTATPIPRTLHMSMIGIRDMSIIDTPPEGRYPVQTYVAEYTDQLLQDALRKEINRGGQCYIVYNQVRKMELFIEHVRALAPEASIAYAHGQMPEAQLEKVMLDFMEGVYDILLCSTIIENGLDIGNVNTLFVLDADHMGLSQLYQLRGRVGRTTRLGYAFFTFARNKVLTEVAHKRLQALMEFAQFGAGRDIAMRDLEIRGAGSMLGAQQHGHIADIGYEYYCKLMSSAVREAKGEAPDAPEVDTVMDVPLSANIPKRYISNEVHRLSMYKRIAIIRDGAALMDVQEELEDRYGDIPEETQNLMDIALLKALCGRAQVVSLHMDHQHARLLFHEQAQLDGAMLLQIATTFGLQILPGDAVTMVYRKEHADARGMLHSLFPLLERLVQCT